MIFHDIRIAIRTLSRAPAFFSTVVITLAVGIGANTAIFSTVNDLLFKPPPGVTQPDRLVTVARETEQGGMDNTSYPNFVDYRDGNRTLEGLAAYTLSPDPMSLGTAEGVDRVDGGLVSWNYFDVLGVEPAVGRFFLPEEDASVGTHLVAVLSHALWRHRFQGDPDIVGHSIRINGADFTVVGVAPRGFGGTGFQRNDIWVPMHAVSVAKPRYPAEIMECRGCSWLVAVGRLAEGVSLEQAGDDLDAVADGIREVYPDVFGDQSAHVGTTGRFPGQARGYVTAFSAILMTIVGLVLAIACFNVAGMMLARVGNRIQDYAVRQAMGASRRRLVASMLIESSILFVAGAIAGLLVSYWIALGILKLVERVPVDIALDPSLDPRVLGFTLLLTLIAALLTGLAPASQLFRNRLIPTLKEGGVGTSGPRRQRLRNTVVLLQVTFSVVLLATAALFLKALDEAAAVDPGFEVSDVYAAQLDLSLAGYDEDTAPGVIDRLEERIGALPGVEGVAHARDLMLDGGGAAYGSVWREGMDPTQPGGSVGSDWNLVSPGFFRLLDIALIRGRGFVSADTEDGAQVAVINREMARQLFGEEDALGRVIQTGQVDEPVPRVVVGITETGKYRTLMEQPQPFIYVPSSQMYSSRVWILIEAAEGASPLDGVRRTIAEVDPRLPVLTLTTMRDYTRVGTLPQELAASIASSLGLVGLILVATGLYGVTAYSVSRRTRELSIRAAMGARPRDLFVMIVRQGLWLSGVGLVVGLALAVALGTAIGGFIMEVSPFDPVVIGGLILLILSVTSAACALPGRRASRMDVSDALRYE